MLTACGALEQYRSDFSHPRVMSSILLADIQVRGLGVLSGLGVVGHAWGSAVSEVRTRVRHTIGMPLHLQQRVRLYGAFAFSVRSLVHIAPPAQTVCRVEQAAVASLARVRS